MSHRNKTNLLCLMLLLLAFSSFKCSKDNDNEDTKPVIVTKSDVDFYLTSANQTSLLKKQNFKLRFGTATNSYPIIRVDSTQVFQEIDGFGYSLTGGSSSVIYALAPAPRAALLKEMFGSDSASLGISYLRISIGASDLDPFPFSYNDLPAGETDVNLNKFSLAPDKAHLIPVLKEILSINPNIKIVFCKIYSRNEG